MRMGKQHIFLLLFLVLGSFIAFSQKHVVADSFDIKKPSIQFPHYCEKWGFQVSAGLSFVKPPKDLLENAIQAPLVNIHSTFGFPWHLSLEGDLTTIVVSNQLMLGPRYTYMYRNFGVKAGWDVAFIYGQIKQGGFDNSTVVWMQYPNLSAGYKLKRMAFTLKGEMVLVTHVSTHSGENEVTTSRDFLNGGTVAFYLEQRIHKNKVFVIGFKDNYVKYYWPTWMLFSTFNRHYHIPELYFSWVL
jgi:hypothetical protein